MMASHTPDHGRASALPLSAVLASIPSYPRPVIERLVTRLIDTLDEQDGDPDEGDPFNEDEPAFDRRSREMVGEFPQCDPDGDYYRPEKGGLGWVRAEDCEDAEDDDADEDGHDAENEAWCEAYDDCPVDVFRGVRRPVRQLGDE